MVPATRLALVLQRGAPPQPVEVSGAWESRTAIQSKVVQKAGSRNPLKNISAKNGAKVTPKAKSSQAAPGSLKISSIGACEGPGSTTLFNKASRKQMKAALTSRQRRRNAVATFHCRPAKKGLFQRSGKTIRHPRSVKR